MTKAAVFEMSTVVAIMTMNMMQMISAADAQSLLRAVSRLPRNLKRFDSSDHTLHLVCASAGVAYACSSAPLPHHSHLLPLALLLPPASASRPPASLSLLTISPRSTLRPSHATGTCPFAHSWPSSALPSTAQFQPGRGAERVAQTRVCCARQVRRGNARPNAFLKWTEFSFTFMTMSQRSVFPRLRIAEALRRVL